MPKALPVVRFCMINGKVNSEVYKLINKEKFKDDVFFDENFFLYLENTDLCLRAKKRDD